MGRILLTWEQGGGLGHLFALRYVAEALLGRGHQVHFASCRPQKAEDVFAGLDVTILPAPLMDRRFPRRIDPTFSMVDILHNVGFGDPGVLECFVRKWRSLMCEIKPDLVLYDFSPTAMLAARGLDFPTAILGNGFCCVPGEDPIRPFETPWCGPAGLLETERFILQNANTVMQQIGAPPLDCLGELYRKHETVFLMTFPECDPYYPRSGGEYCGVWTMPLGAAPHWPEGAGQRTFVYVEQFSGLGELLGILRESGWSVLVYAPGLSAQTKAQHESASLRFAAGPVNMIETLAGADLTIASGTTTSEQSLLAGTPVLRIPMHAEQLYTGLSLARTGASIVVSPPNEKRFTEAFAAMTSCDDYTQAARRFAKSRASFNPSVQISQIADRIDEIIGNRKQKPIGDL